MSFRHTQESQSQDIQTPNSIEANDEAASMHYIQYAHTMRGQKNTYIGSLTIGDRNQYCMLGAHYTSGGGGGGGGGG